MTKGLVLLATVLITACHKTTPPIDRRAALNQCMMGFYDEVPADNNPAGIEVAKHNFNRCLEKNGLK